MKKILSVTLAGALLGSMALMSSVPASASSWASRAQGKSSTYESPYYYGGGYYGNGYGYRGYRGGYAAPDYGYGRGPYGYEYEDGFGAY